MKKLILFSCIMCIAAAGACVVRADEIAQAPVASDQVAQWITTLAGAHPWVLTVSAVIGALRLLVKPLFTFLHSVVLVTPSEKDDQLLLKCESSKVFKWVVWALDYFASVKLIHPKA